MSFQDNFFFQPYFLVLVVIILILVSVFGNVFLSINEASNPGSSADKISKNFYDALYSSVDLLAYFFIAVMILSFIMAFFVYYSPIMIFFTFLFYIFGVFLSIILKYVYDNVFTSQVLYSSLSSAPLLSFLLDHYIVVNVFWLSGLLFFMYISPIKIFRGGYY